MGVSFNNRQHDYALLKRAQDKRVSDIALGTLDTKDPDADTHLLLVEAKSILTLTKQVGIQALQTRICS